ncbi:MAG: hypothetical protein IPK68_02375 [Bdellovibrionales bacterium]|nr:hypothetical protein [Bdellovibrionales bacterium]
MSLGHNRITEGLRASRCTKIEILLLEGFTVICHGRQIIDFCMNRMPTKGRSISIATSAKPSVQRKLPEALMIICHDRPEVGILGSGPQALGDSVVSKLQGRLAEASLRGSGSSSAWCSAHNVSAAAGRMFEDPGLLRFGSARRPWSLEQQSSVARLARS